MKAEPKNLATWILLVSAVRHEGHVGQMEAVLLNRVNGIRENR